MIKKLWPCGACNAAIDIAVGCEHWQVEIVVVLSARTIWRLANPEAARLQRVEENRRRRSAARANKARQEAAKVARLEVRARQQVELDRFRTMMTGAYL